MEKSIHSARYAVFSRPSKLRERRPVLRRYNLPSGSDETQTFVSKCERGERRIDVMELRMFCQAFGLSLKQFVGALEKSISKGR
jgi:hypothetical protein